LNVALYIARRYLFSSKSKNAVNSITAISVLGVAVGTLALVVVLSVFNGFETLIKSMYQEVNPDFEVTSAVSKSFTLTDSGFEELKSLAPWDAVEQVYQEKVLLRVANKEQIALLKGVHLWPANSSKSIKSHIIKGSSYTDLDTDNWAVIGQSLAYTLSASVNEVLKIFVPNQKANATINNSQAFKEKQFMLAGIYAVQAEYDAAYILADLGVVQDFLDKPLALTSLAFSIAGSHDLSEVKQSLQMHFGSDFEVKNRYEQQEFLYKVLQTEKWAIFFILAFILLIATFTIVASVVIIVLEKRKDISSLWALGAPVKTIQKIFFYEGLLITIFGGGLGLVLGVSVCLLQQHFGFIQLGSQGSFIVNSYPVEVHYKDVILIVCTVLSLGILITFIPVRLLKQKFIQQH
jgi:lipoprotein-releasing system permease protein